MMRKSSICISLPSFPCLLKNVSFSLDQEELAIGDRLLVKNLSLTLQGQDKIGIIGSNGVGKSTFLKKIWEILQNNESIRTAYMPQDYTEGLPLTQTPVQFLQHSGDREEINTIQLHLASLNFTYSEMHHPISELSGGQQETLPPSISTHKSPVSALGRAYS